MATNGYNNDNSLLRDDSDDILNMLDLSDGDDPFAAAGSYDPFDWTAMANSSDIAGPSTSAHHQDIAAPSSSAHHHNFGASTSSVHQSPLNCTGCQILREVVHSNGHETTKLCIHGAAGLFYHATREEYLANPESMVPALTHQSFTDFRDRDYAWVKQYLVDYAQKRASSGYIVVQDSISTFHDVLCTSMLTGGGHADDPREVVAPAEARNGAGDAVVPMVRHEEAPRVSGPAQQTDNAVAAHEQQEVRPVVRSEYAIQRERIKKLTREDISRYFHIPLKAACKKLRVSATALKDIRQRFHIKRWPYRTLQRIDTQITNLSNGNDSAAVLEEIKKLTDSRRKIIDGQLDPDERSADS